MRLPRSGQAPKSMAAPAAWMQRVVFCHIYALLRVYILCGRYHICISGKTFHLPLVRVFVFQIWQTKTNKDATPLIYWPIWDTTFFMNIGDGNTRLHYYCIYGTPCLEKINLTDLSTTVGSWSTASILKVSHMHPSLNDHSPKDA